jgi:hypothetical protein
MYLADDVGREASAATRLAGARTAHQTLQEVMTKMEAEVKASDSRRQEAAAAAQGGRGSGGPR